MKNLYAINLFYLFSIPYLAEKWTEDDTLNERKSNKEKKIKSSYSTLKQKQK